MTLEVRNIEREADARRATSGGASNLTLSRISPKTTAQWTSS